MRILLGLGALLSNVDEVIEQKASRESKSKQQSQRINDKYFYNIYTSKALSLDLCYSHFRA